MRGSKVWMAPPPWLSATRKRGNLFSNPPVINDAAARPISPGNATICSSAGGPTSRSIPAGRNGCTKSAALHASAASKNGQKRGSPIGTPPTLLPTSIPASPSVPTANSSSRIAQSMSCIGAAPRALKRPGDRATMFASTSFR